MRLDAVGCGIGSDNSPLPPRATGKEIFATHYVNASLDLTAVIRGEDGSHNYLAYLNRFDIDGWRAGSRRAASRKNRGNACCGRHPFPPTGSPVPGGHGEHARGVLRGSRSEAV